MAVQIVVKVVPGGLRAANVAEASKLDELVGREVMATLKADRNLGFHKKFFALLKYSRDMADTEMNAEQWRAIVTCGAGHCTWVHHEGKSIAIPKSISFASMDEVEFEQLYSDALDYICKNYVHDSPEELDAILSFM
jgi:hypothetical protein